MSTFTLYAHNIMAKIKSKLKKIKNKRRIKKMKALVQVQEIDGEGLEALLGERVLLMCAGYFYEGKLIGVNGTFVKIDDAAIVYATGTWSDKSYADIQKLHQKEWYVQRALIESFGKSKNG